MNNFFAKLATVSRLLQHFLISGFNLIIVANKITLCIMKKQKVIQLLMWFNYMHLVANYGNTGCQVFKQGGQN